MRFRGGEFSTGTKGNFQSELTGARFLDIAAIKPMILGEYPLIQIHSPWR